MSSRFLCWSCWLGCRLRRWGWGSFCWGGLGSGSLTSISGFGSVIGGGLGLLLLLVCNFISDLVVVSSDLLLLGLILGQFVVLLSDLLLNFGALYLLESGNLSIDFLLDLDSVLLRFFLNCCLLLFESVLMVTENFSDTVEVGLSVLPHVLSGVSLLLHLYIEGL